MDLDFVSVPKHAKKELGQYPAILTSHLVNNPYLGTQSCDFLTEDDFSVLVKSDVACCIAVRERS